MFTERRPTLTTTCSGLPLSNHLVQQKLGIVHTLMSRAETIIEDPALLNTEKQKIRDALQVCGYPEWALRECDTTEKPHKTPPTRTRDQDKPSQHYVVLSYVKGVTERLKQTLAKHNVSLYSKPGYTLRNALVKPKDPLDDMEKCGVIYKVGCEECGQVYVGETERSLGERTLEHQKSLNREDCKSALSQHQMQTGHAVRPIMDNLQILDQEPRNTHRTIKEAILIKLNKASLSRNEGWDITDVYLPLLRREVGGGTSELSQPRSDLDLIPRGQGHTVIMTPCCFCSLEKNHVRSGK